MRLLLVEDERKVSDLVARALRAESYAVDVAEDGLRGWELAQSYQYDLIILDLMLPQLPGEELLRRIRRTNQQVPILVLTARGTTADKVHNFEAGADDYLTKPFAFSELLARIRALLRRGRMDQILKLRHEDLEMDLVTHKVSRGSESLDLTAKEFDILEYLLRHSGSVVSREMLARDVWHATARATPLDNVIDVTIARLRRKIDEPYVRKLLHTVRGVGFILGGGQE